MLRYKFLFILAAVLVLCAGALASELKTVPISLDSYKDKLLGGWFGQMAGVTYGAPTEFRWQEQIIPEASVPVWKPENINNGFGQDDIYVEVPFLVAMDKKGVNCGWDVFGEYFRDTKFGLWHANRFGRKNLQKGIPAPDSGHYLNNDHCDDIDWQIEADMVGMLCPGMYMPAIDLSWRAGHVMNYGDGVYGGVAVAAMHAAAFFAKDVDEIIEAGRTSLPEGTEYRQVIDDLLTWKKQGKTWEENWQLLQDKWGRKDRCPEGSSEKGQKFNIDASINGAYVFMGLAYGGGGFLKSTTVAMRCGQDSDCNPSTVGSILGNWIGFEKMPAIWKEKLDHTKKFNYTNYTLDDLVNISVKLARQVVLMSGGMLVGGDGGEVWHVPQQSVVAPIYEQWPEKPNARPILKASVRKQQGKTVTFTAQAVDIDGIKQYQWFFGDLSYSNGPLATHTYLPGAYTAICYVTDETGNTAWKAVPVEVK